MDPAGTASTDSSLHRNLSSRSSSFRLRCSSLNSVRLRRVFDIFDKNGDGLITVEEISQALVLLGLDSNPSESTLGSIIKNFIKDGSNGLTFEDFESLHKSLNDTFFKLDDEYEDACSDDVTVEDDEEAAEDEEDHKHTHHLLCPGGCGAGAADCYNIASINEEEKRAQEESDLSEAFKVFDEDGDGFISARELQVVLEKLGLPEAKEMDRVERMISSVDRNHDGLVDFLEFKDMMRSFIVHSY